MDKTAEAILSAAEARAGLVSMAQERAACGEWPTPETPADFLFWIEDEEQIQRDLAEARPEEAEERAPYADLLHHYAALLRQAGVWPSCPVWSYEYILRHLLKHLEALSARFQGGEDLGRIFDGTDLFRELAEKVQALDRARGIKDAATGASES